MSVSRKQSEGVDVLNVELGTSGDLDTLHCMAMGST